jgi:integrase
MPPKRPTFLQEQDKGNDDVFAIRKSMGVYMIQLSQNKPQADYNPRIRFVPNMQPYRGKLTERSYIEVYAWDTTRKAEIRRRLFQFNGGHSSTLEKQLFAEDYVIPLLRRLLLQGYAFGPPTKAADGRPTVATITPDMSLIEALYASYASAENSTALSEATLKAYKTTLNVMETFAPTVPWMRWPFGDVSTVHIKEMQTWVRQTRSKSAANNFLRAFSALVGRAADQMGAAFNFTHRAKLARVEKRRNTIFRESERKRMERAIDSVHPHLRLVWQMVHYGFIRSGKELLTLRLRDIYLQEGEIMLFSDVAKTDHTRHILIIPQLREVLLSLNLHDLPQDWFLIGKGGKPGPSRYAENYWTTLHRECVVAAGLDPNRYNLYSWRSTGAYRALAEWGYNILWLMRQMGHSSLDVTSKYLSSMGLGHLTDTTKPVQQAQVSAPEAPKQPQNKTAALMQLNYMLRDGLITREEFSTLKNEILC